MALTGSVLLAGFSRFIEDHWAGTTTSAGAADGTTLVDTSLRRYGEDAWRDFYVRPTGATNAYAIRRATAGILEEGRDPSIVQGCYHRLILAAPGDIKPRRAERRIGRLWRPTCLSSPHPR